MVVKIPHADEGTICPLHREDMSKVCHKCPWWTRIVGKHPQSEEMIDDWRCAIAWLPMLLIENSQMNRQQTAALESFRNGVVEAVGDGVVQAIGAAAQNQRRLQDANFPHRRG